MRLQIHPKFVFCVLAGMLISQAAEAKKPRGIVHRVRTDGQTYADLADHYYGRRFLERHLHLYNRRKEPLKRGTSIIIPTFRVVPFKRGQTLEQFAAAHLLDEKLAPYLSALHNITPKRRPKRLRVVSSFKHVVRPGETLKTIAKAYYRDSTPRRIKLLMLYNKLSNRRVKNRMRLRIPMDTSDFNHRTVAERSKKPIVPRTAKALAKSSARSPAKPARRTPKRNVAAMSTAERKKERQQQRREIVSVLESAERLYSDGEFKDCARLMRRTIKEHPKADDDKMVELLRLRAFSLIALGDFEDSRRHFRSLLKIDPEYALDLYQTSPKILDIFNSVAMR